MVQRSCHCENPLFRGRKRLPLGASIRQRHGTRHTRVPSFLAVCELVQFIVKKTKCQWRPLSDWQDPENQHVPVESTLPFRRGDLVILVILVGSAGLIDIQYSDDIRRETLGGFREQITSLSISYLTVSKIMPVTNFKLNDC